MSEPVDVADEVPDPGARCTVCGVRAVVLAYLSHGCQALNWQYQWLCAQHEMSLTPVGDCTYLVDYREGGGGRAETEDGGSVPDLAGRAE